MNDNSHNSARTVEDYLDQLSDQQRAGDGVVRFFGTGSAPETDVVYYEYVDESHAITHETRDEVGLPADTTRIEVTERYESGLTREKFALVPNSLRDLVWAIVVVLLVSPFLAGSIDRYGFALSLTIPIATLSTVLVAALIICVVFFVWRAVSQLRKVYRLRAIGRSRRLSASQNHD